MPHDDPNEITEYLIEQHGLDGAITVAMNNAVAASDKETHHCQRCSEK